MKRRLQLLIALFLAAVLAFAVVPSGLSGRAGAPVAFALQGKHISISLSRQRLRAWDGNHVVLSTPVTTGNRALPTPTGWFHIFYKTSPFTFVSPWPYGSPYWYPNSPVTWVMEFAGGGYYIHDAPWRSVFGKGSNSQLGTPGNNYTGTHGCVNVPFNAMKFLYSWAPLGTPVHIVP
jgi:lipoprotein-anchoring transpeptidase ErfK/SrfK